jgi:hypothetical protein
MITWFEETVKSNIFYKAHLKFTLQQQYALFLLSSLGDEISPNSRNNYQIHA